MKLIYNLNGYKFNFFIVVIPAGFWAGIPLIQLLSKGIPESEGIPVGQKQSGMTTSQNFKLLLENLKIKFNVLVKTKMKVLK